ncbi:hypothetical protein DdX_13330 [Ditylenchus destructor]|uniref:Uncharacterized protein n=1 Tax=Ditylenchus destructor TaxID=166010 RepID=A0AAD4MUR1_9BILA|nr:hypothetical protein DdX_13330 [Ditylenchus destructor]
MKNRTRVNNTKNAKRAPKEKIHIFKLKGRKVSIDANPTAGRTTNSIIDHLAVRDPVGSVKNMVAWLFQQRLSSGSWLNTSPRWNIAHKMPTKS